MATTGTKVPAVEAILHALRQHPNATAAELADHASIGRSTATKALASLAAEGRATRQRGGRVDGRIIPDRWSLVSDAPTAAEQSPAEEPVANPAGAATRQDGQQGNQTPASDTSDTRAAEPTTTTTSQAAAPTDNEASAPRLGHGQLRDLVCGYLAERPGQEFTPHQIAKVLGRSTGAVSNALTSKAVQDQIVQTSTRPRRYMLASQPSGAAKTQTAKAS